MLSLLFKRSCVVLSRRKTLPLFSLGPRVINSRSYTTKVKSKTATVEATEKRKEVKPINLLTDQQNELLSLKSPNLVSTDQINLIATQARLVDLCAQSKDFKVIKHLFTDLLEENTDKLHLLKLLTTLGEIEVENVKYDKQIIELAEEAIKRDKLRRKEVALVLLKIFLWRGRMEHVQDILLQLEKSGLTITEGLYYQVLLLGLRQQKYEFMNMKFQEMLLKGVTPTPLTYSLMARGYAAAKKKDLATVLVDKIQLGDYNIDIIYNLIFMHCMNGDTFKAINLLEVLLKQKGAISEEEEIKVWKAMFLSFRSIKPPMNVVNDVVKMVESRKFKYMDEIYLSIIRSLPDVTYVEEFMHALARRQKHIPHNVWMELITMQAQRGYYNASLFTWRDMIALGIEPSKKRCEQMIMLSQYVKRSEARWTYQRLKEIVFEPMKKFKPENQPDAHTYNLMIKAALVMKRPAKALELWDEIDANNIPTVSEKMISREEIQEIAHLKEAFEIDKKKKMEALNPMSRGVSFDRTDVVCITELIRKYLKEYKDSTSVADWDCLPPTNLNKYFTVTERQILQQKGVNIDEMPTLFDHKTSEPSDKTLLGQEINNDDEVSAIVQDDDKTQLNDSEVLNKEDFDEFWILDSDENSSEKITEPSNDKDNNDNNPVVSEQSSQSSQDIIARNSTITEQSRNFRGTSFAPANHWRYFFFVYNRLIGEGFGYTLAQAKEDTRIKMLDPNSRFFQFIKERVTEEEFDQLLTAYQDSRKFKKYSVYWAKINRTAEEREKNREIAAHMREAKRMEREANKKVQDELRAIKAEKRRLEELKEKEDGNKTDVERMVKSIQ